MTENQNGQETIKEPALEEGVYIFMDNTLHKIETGYKKLCATLKPGEIDMPQNSGVLNNFYG